MYVWLVFVVVFGVDCSCFCCGVDWSVVVVVWDVWYIGIRWELCVKCSVCVDFVIDFIEINCDI